MNPKNDSIGQDEKLKTYPFLYSMRSSIYQTGLGLLGSIVLLMVIGLGTALAEKIPEETHQKLKGLRIPFIMNQGQMDRQVRFYAKTFSGTVYVTDQGKMVYQLPTSKDSKKQEWVLVEETLESLPVKEIKGEKESETQVSFFIGNDPAKWKSGLPTYETVDLGEVYKGISLKLRAYGGSVEKLYYISPGREPKEIRIKLYGADAIKVNDHGELEVQTGNGPVIFSRPQAFQQEGSQQKEVEVAYLVDGDRYGFKVGSYDKSRELIIDPLIQSTYLGGTGADYAYSMAISGGDVYVAGTTSTTNFPGTSGGAQPALGGNSDAFVSLLSADLKQLVRSTYLGGNDYDYGQHVAVSGGFVYVAGTTFSKNFPRTSGGAQPAHGGGNLDTFVSQLTANLQVLIQSTYLGGTGDDDAASLVVSGGNVYVVGYTSSTDFPKTSGGAQPLFGGGGTDAFVSMLTPQLDQIVQSTYLGGTKGDYADSIVVFFGYIYVAGDTASTDFPGTGGGAQPVYGGGWSDAFVSMLSTDLKQLVRSTYLGGTGNETVHSIATSGGNIYVAGYTDSTNFPHTTGGAQSAFGGDTDAFVSMLSNDLKQLVQSTYLGGTGEDYAQHIIISASISGGNVYVVGYTNSTDFPGTTGGAQPGYGGGTYDAYVSLLSTDLKQLVRSTFLGGIDFDYAYSIAVSSGGNVYVAGSTKSSDFPGTTGGPQPGYGGGNSDAFVALLTGDLKKVSAMPWLFLLLGN